MAVETPQISTQNNDFVVHFVYVRLCVLLQLYLYGKDTKKVTYNEFVNRELVLFSNMDNERSIPSLVDGKCHLLSISQLIYLTNPLGSFNNTYTEAKTDRPHHNRFTALFPGLPG